MIHSGYILLPIIKIMRTFAKFAAGITTTGVLYGVANPQQRENVYGAYRSIVNSSRAGVILYRAVKDYELSLMGLEYNSE